eukprot:CAMPEP_0113679200 /NCGR_PEP_ID=MMETSP0038_2-20120614/10464_1 /TAXON_ID=2898 /ORGANISM="Cryptomonas paramecium" /LENGTH=85 /DNA_ID=CAMNT_0000597109 /DNA_START=647 /DNA_END=904 /DNA_ORIENTATION=+ /assembly_acc=CAM_ASM_000170
MASSNELLPPSLLALARAIRAHLVALADCRWQDGISRKGKRGNQGSGQLRSKRPTVVDRAQNLLANNGATGSATGSAGCESKYID